MNDDFVAVDKDGLVHDRRIWSHVPTSDQVLVGQRRGRIIDCMACVAILAQAEVGTTCMTCVVLRNVHSTHERNWGIHVDALGVGHHTVRESWSQNAAVLCSIEHQGDTVYGYDKVAWQPSVR